MKNHLKQFKEKTYFAHKTVIITVFGDICKLEDYSLLHLLRPEHYILVTDKDLKQEKNLKNTVREFSININKNWESNLENFIADVAIWVTAQAEKTLQGTAQDQSKLISYVLNNLIEDSNKINNLVPLFSTDLSKFKKDLKKLITQEFSGKLREKTNKESFLADLKKLFPKTKDEVQKHNFVEKQVERLINNSDTKDIFIEVLSLPDVKIIIANDFKKFQEITGNKSLGRVRAGQSSTHGKLISVYWGEFYSEFPSLSLLGGMQLDTNAGFANCFELNGAEEGRTQEFRTPLVRLLAEEFFDYLLRLSQMQEGEAFNANLEKFDLQADLFNVDKLKKLAAQPAVTNLLEENKILIDKSEEIIDQQNKIVDLVLAGKALKGKQKDIWEAMLTKGPAIYKAAEPTSGRILLNTATKTSVGSEGSIGPQKVKIPVVFKEFLSQEKLHCTTTPGSQVGLWETTVVKDNLNEQQVASLYKWFIDEYKQIVFEAKQYATAKVFGEFLGKLFGYQVFFPRYLETFLPKIHSLYKEIYQNKPQLTAASCVGETCVNACEVFPSYKPFNNTQENSTFDDKAQLHQNNNYAIPTKSEEQQIQQQSTVAWLSQELASAAKTVLGVPEKSFMEHAANINSKSIEKPSAAEQLVNRLNQTMSIEEYKIVVEFVIYFLTPYLPTLPWNQLHTLSDKEKNQLNDCLEEITKLIARSSKLKQQPIGKYNLVSDQFSFLDKEISQVQNNIHQPLKNKEITVANFSAIHKRISHVKEILDRIEQQNHTHKKQFREIDRKKERLLSRGKSTGQQQRQIALHYDAITGVLTHEIVACSPELPAQSPLLQATTNQTFWKQQDVIAIKPAELSTGKTIVDVPKLPAPKH